MFLAVQKYGSDSVYLIDKITILDTKDGTVETVNIADVIGFEIKNTTSQMSQLLWHSFMSLLSLYEDKEYNVDVEVERSGVLRYKKWLLECHNGFLAYCNKVPITKYSVRASEIAYVFSFKEYLIVRALSVNGSDSYWYSAAFNSRGDTICMWIENMNTVIGNKDFAMRVDMVSEV